MKKLEIPDKEVLHKLYIEEKLSMSKIATLFNTSSMTVRSWIKSLGIDSRVSNISVYHELRDINFSTIQKKLLIGSLLGDGGLRIPKRGKNANFFEKHCEKQRMYLEWKRDLLMPFVQRKLDIEIGGSHIISGVKCNTQTSYRFNTISHPYLTELWNKFYIGNGNKILPTDIEKYIDEFVLAVWICDDGCLTWKYRYYKLDIHTENFTYEENVVIKSIIENFFKGKVSIYNRKYKSGVKHYICLRGKQELHEFCNTLKIFVPDNMHYKFKTYI